jgi:hypothetical protein
VAREPEPGFGASTPDFRPLRLRYPGTCVECGTSLAEGTAALYDGRLKKVRCVTCPLPDANTSIVVDPGIAGGSAQREYERRVANREARVKQRYGQRIGGAVLALSGDPQSIRAWAQGSKGEQELANALGQIQGIRLLHDRRVPGTRGNIDHLVVAPSRVFVVDAKLYTGKIHVRDVGGLFRRDERLFVGRRDCSKLADNMAWQVEAVEQSLARASVEPPPSVVPVLCFVRGEWPLLFPPDSFRGVRLESLRSLRELISRESLLDEATIDRAWRELAAALPPK